MSTNESQLSRSSMGSHDRKLRYRALLEDLSTFEDDVDNNVELMDKTASAVKEAQTLLAEGGVEERVKHPGEGYLDSRVLRAASDLAVRCSEAVSGNVNTYDKHELAQHIRENPYFWEFPFPLELPTTGYLFGTFAPTPLEQRPRAPRRHVEKQQAAALKAPENVQQKRSRCTNIQKNFLVNAMSANRELATGVAPTPAGIQRQNQAWEALTKELNQLGPHKTAHQWKITWRDLRAKFKDRKNRRAQQARNIAVVNFLTPQDDRISSIIGKTTPEGISGDPESGISETEECESISPVKLRRQSSPFLPEGCVASLCDATITSPADPLEVHHTAYSTRRPQSALSFEGIHQSTPTENLELLRDIAGSLQRTNFLLEEQNRISMERNDILRQLIGSRDEKVFL